MTKIKNFKEKQNKMKKLTKILVSALCVAAIGGSVAAFGGCGKTETIEISGSTSVNEIMTTLAGEYEKSHNVRININGNGSSAGIEDTLSGRNDFGMASRALKDEEIADGLEGKQLCLDGIVLAVGKDCALSQVTNEQIYNLYINGTAITDNGATINAASGRDASSGTREAFDEKICDSEGVSIKTAKKTYNGDVRQLKETGLVIDSIRNDSYNRTMGYISLGSYLKNTSTLKALKFKAHNETEYVEATVENVKNASYKLQRPFVIVTKKDGTLSATAQQFYDWLFGDEAKTIISANGYVL